MKSFLKKHAGALLTAFGILLIIASAFLLFADKFQNKQEEKQGKEIIEQLEAVIPPLSRGVPNRNADAGAGMAAVDIGGVGYIGILQIPVLGISLPVGDSGASIAPNRISGNAKAQTLLINGSGSEYGKISDINEGDSVVLTDVRGNVWRYQVEAIRIAATDTDPVADEAAALTLTLKESDRWLIVSCKGDSHDG